MIALLLRVGVKVLSAAKGTEWLPWKRSAMTVAVGVVSLLAVPCDESTSPHNHQAEPSGAVQGHVLGSGQPVVTSVGLSPVPAPAWAHD